MSITGIPEGHRLVTFQYETRAALAELAKLIKGEEDLAATRWSGLTKAQDGYEELAKKVGASTTKLEEQNKKFGEANKQFSTQGKALDTLDKKLGDIGKNFGSMAASFGVGLGVGAVSSAINQLFAPSPETVQQLTEITTALHKMGATAPAFEVLNKHYEDQLTAARALEQQNDKLKDNFERVQKVVEKYSDTFRLQEFKKDLSANSQALASGRIDVVDYTAELGRLTQAYGNATAGADSFAVKIQNIKQSIEDQYNSKAMQSLAVISMIASGQITDPTLIRDLTKRFDTKLPKGPGAKKGGVFNGGSDVGTGYFGQGVADPGGPGRDFDDVLKRLELERTAQSDLADEILEIRQKADAQKQEIFGAEADNAAYWLKVQEQIKSEQVGGATWLSNVIGPIEEFDAYKIAFDTLTGAAGTAYDALVDGEISASAATGAFIKETIKGVGKHMLFRGLQEAAEAVAFLAHGNFGAAATASKSALMFFAGSAAAGAFASGGGSGGGVGGGGAAGAAPGPNYGNSNQGGGNTYYVGIGDSFAQDNYRHQVASAARMVKLAKQRGVSNGPEDVTY